jgi:DNA ligase (NAD+)
MHFLSTLDVKGFGDKTVEKLMDAGKLKDPADLYSLYPGDIADLEGGSEKVAIKLLRELRDKSDGVPLPKFVKALGFELFGESYTEIVMETFPSLAAMRQLTEADVAGIPRIGPAIAQAMVHGFKHNKELIDKLLPHVRIAERKLTGPLSGKVFCFTGLRDKGAEQDIEDQGGKVAEKYTKAVTHLICKDPKGKSEKLERARKEGAEILSLDALKSLLTTS